jgi:hypothetical protein
MNKPMLHNDNMFVQTKLIWWNTVNYASFSALDFVFGFCCYFENWTFLIIQKSHTTTNVRINWQRIHSIILKAIN